MTILRLINWLVDVGGFYDMCVGVSNKWDGDRLIDFYINSQGPLRGLEITK